jgi:hypothetical protein
VRTALLISYSELGMKVTNNVLPHCLLGINLKCYMCDSKTSPNCSDPASGNLSEVTECKDIFPLLVLHLSVDPSDLTGLLLYGCQKLEVQGI